jgi:hypothetical protein
MIWTAWIRGAGAALAMTALLSAGAGAAELFMYRTAGCPWCAQWDAAIGPIYPKTEVGRRAPLRMVNMDKEKGPDVDLARPVRYSPTFVLVDGGREIGRIEGYPGEDFFWGLVENLVLKLPRRESTTGAAPVGGSATPLQQSKVSQ